MHLDSFFVTLVSSDNHRFVVLKEVALISPVLRNSEEFKEGETGQIILDIDAEILEVVVEYLYYSYKYKDQADSAVVPDFKIPTQLALELLVKADFLDL